MHQTKKAARSGIRAAFAYLKQCFMKLSSYNNQQPQISFKTTKTLLQN
jgi:hypothetical protein